MEFSFNGTLDELEELGLLISGTQVASVEVPVIVDSKELTDSAGEERSLELQTPQLQAIILQHLKIWCPPLID